MLYAFDLIEQDGHDLRDLPFLPRLPRDSEAAILVNEHIAEDVFTVFAHACRLGAEGIVSKRVDGIYRSGPCSVWIKVRNPASIAVQRERSDKWPTMMLVILRVQSSSLVAALPRRILPGPTFVYGSLQSALKCLEHANRHALRISGAAPLVPCGIDQRVSFVSERVH
jgi:hypothetical protein